eukprot:TRINITY_DN112917_c0_g1_i1.p1 TRINITY_DN112917_c0_g1~~TRINITY_DN112917_c0_g1_i1.p1  ORF type:complete len:389 (+),score=150.13 TRINITY_DN112917_c0_g1_i1:138-1304(+)
MKLSTMRRLRSLFARRCLSNTAQPPQPATMTLGIATVDTVQLRVLEGLEDLRTLGYVPRHLSRPMLRDAARLRRMMDGRERRVFVVSKLDLLPWATAHAPQLTLDGQRRQKPVGLLEESKQREERRAALMAQDGANALQSMEQASAWLDSVSVPLGQVAESETLKDMRRDHYSRVALVDNNEKQQQDSTELSEEQSAFLDAVIHGDIETVKSLLEADRSLLSARSPQHGGTALHLAAQDGHVALLSLLVSTYGMDVDARSHNDATPLHWAAGMGRADCVRALLELGADAEARTVTWKSSVFGKGSGQTAVHWASESGHVDVLRVLAEFAPSVLVEPDERENVPLDLAEKELQSQSADLIASTIGDTDVVYVEVSLSVDQRRMTLPLID